MSENNISVNPTIFLDDFIAYYQKAKILQNDKDAFVDDPLMDNVKIYDLVERPLAGFSNALKDLHGKRKNKELSRIAILKSDSKIIKRFLHLFHRFTGSGVSFEHDHGYRNSILYKFVDHINEVGDHDGVLKECIGIMLDHEGPMVSSIGNQPPSLKNPQPEKYRLAQHYYFDNFAIDFITDYTAHLDNSERRLGIKELVDYCVGWHKERGFKQWFFVMTHFVMDDAEYYPEDVDADSYCYFGSNSNKAFQLMFEKPVKSKVDLDKFHEKCMDYIVEKTGAQPYSIEAVCCDIIRYWTEYVPKSGYGFLSLEETKNNSLLKVDGEYTEYAKCRFSEVFK